MAILRKVAWFVIASCRSLVQIHPPPPFSDYFAQCICPKRCAGFLVRKRKKTGPGAVSLTIPKPVFTYFTVFWAIFALKARKLPDLSGRQIRQLLCCITLKRCLETGYYCQKYTCGYSFNQHSSLENQGIECYSNNKGIA